MNKKILRTLTALCAALVLMGGFSVTAFAQTPEGEDATNDSGVVYELSLIHIYPEAEYFSLVQRLDGQVIRLSPTGKGIDGKPQYVNPMDINLNYSEDDSPLALKSDFILSLCELVIGGDVYKRQGVLH